VSGKLWHEDVGKALEWIAAGGSQGQCRLLIVFGDFHGWDTQSL